MTDEKNRDCHQCGAKPGERHEMFCQIARCRSTGIQQIQCDGELHTYKGREYGEHEGPCEPDVWDGEYPGVKQCRELGLYTKPGSFWGVTEDLNTLVECSTWDPISEKYIYRAPK